jgi:hypothetical protein
LIVVWNYGVRLNKLRSIPVVPKTSIFPRHWNALIWSTGTMKCIFMDQAVWNNTFFIMKYNLENKAEADEARSYLEKLIAAKSMAEIKKNYHRRSLNQNNYLHLLLSYCAINYGETLEYFKQVLWKQLICPDLFRVDYTNPVTGETRDDWRSSAELSSKEMTVAVDRLINWAAKEMGIELPLADDHHHLRQIENQIEKNKQYL